MLSGQGRFLGGCKWEACCLAAGAFRLPPPVRGWVDGACAQPSPPSPCLGLGFVSGPRADIQAGGREARRAPSARGGSPGEGIGSNGGVPGGRPPPARVFRPREACRPRRGSQTRGARQAIR